MKDYKFEEIIVALFANSMIYVEKPTNTQHLPHSSPHTCTGYWRTSFVR
jgi:hypothetical protein